MAAEAEHGGDFIYGIYAGLCGCADRVGLRGRRTVPFCILVPGDSAFAGKRGVYSHRFMGEDTPYPIKCLEVIKQVEGKTRSARFECCITLLNFDETPHQFNGVIEGNIGYEIKGEHGFGYDPIFIPIGYDMTTAEMESEMKNSISHRGNASRLLVKFLKEKGVK